MTYSSCCCYCLIVLQKTKRDIEKLWKEPIKNILRRMCQLSWLKLMALYNHKDLVHFHLCLLFLWNNKIKLKAILMSKSCNMFYCHKCVRNQQIFFILIYLITKNWWIFCWICHHRVSFSLSGNQWQQQLPTYHCPWAHGVTNKNMQKVGDLIDEIV